MQIKISLKPINDCVLPDFYRSSVQGLIYHLLSNENPVYANFLHDMGYHNPNEKRPSFKMFCFSGIHDERGLHPPRDQKNQGYRLYNNEIYNIVFSSPKEEFITTILFGLFNETKQILIDNCRLRIVDVLLLQPPDISDITSIRLTPFYSGIVARAKKGVLPDNKYYLTLNERVQLEKQLLDGLLMRVKEHFNKTLSFDDCYLSFCVADTKPETIKKHIRTFPVIQNRTRHTLVSTYCDLDLKGPYELLIMALLAGIGEKTSLGMGMVKFFVT